MSTSINYLLVFAAALSAIAALMHVAIIVGGGPMYRRFGAGEKLAAAAESGRTYPAIITASIAVLLGVFSAYALSGANVLPTLPLLKLALILITAVYLLRGLALIPLLTVARAQATAFLIWSSVICLVYGIAHLIGLMQVWPQLAPIFE